MSGPDLLIPQSALWYMLFVAVLTGIALGVFCDGLFILRLLSGDPTTIATRRRMADASDAPPDGRRRVLYAILGGWCDLMLALTAAVTLIVLCYYTSDGQFRAPAIIGMIAGFWGYHKTVSRLVRRAAAAVLGVARRVLCTLWAHTFGRLWAAASRAVTRRVRTSLTERRIARLTDRAADGFGLSDERPRERMRQNPPKNE